MGIQDELEDLDIPSHFRFRYGGAPCGFKQERKRSAHSCLPTIVLLTTEPKKEATARLKLTTPLVVDAAAVKTDCTPTSTETASTFQPAASVHPNAPDGQQGSFGDQLQCEAGKKRDDNDLQDSKVLNDDIKDAANQPVQEQPTKRSASPSWDDHDSDSALAGSDEDETDNNQGETATGDVEASVQEHIASSDTHNV